LVTLSTLRYDLLKVTILLNVISLLSRRERPDPAAVPSSLTDALAEALLRPTEAGNTDTFLRGRQGLSRRTLLDHGDTAHAPSAGVVDNPAVA